MKNKSLSFFGLVFFIILVCAGSMQGGLIIVPTDYSTIQAAVDNASPHDLIYVCAGTYSESVRVNKPLKLIAEGGAQSVKLVKVNPTPKGGTFGFFIDADYVTIDGFEICGTNYGISSDEGSFCRIVNNHIHDMTCTNECGGPGYLDGGFGICLGNFHASSDYNLIASNVLEKIPYSAIQVQGWAPNVVTGSMIVGNEIRNSGDIHLAHAENCAISHNFLEYTRDWAINLSTMEAGIVSQNNLIAHNIIKHVIGGRWGAGIYISARQAEGCAVEKNNIHHNYIEDVQPGSEGWQQGIGIQMSGSYNLVHHNTVVSVTLPYNEGGTGNKVFKNSWQ